MRKGFRQSMAWLHTWAGLLLGWVLYFMFVTGTVGYFDTEIDYWMRPEVTQRSAPPSTAESIAMARRRLEQHAAGVTCWTLYPPGGHDIPEIVLSWRERPSDAGPGRSRSEVLDRQTGRPVEARATGGGEALYQMHYRLRYLPSDASEWIVGVATMFMLVAIVTGVITHKKIVSDFFTFRPRKGQRSWLDAHNVLSVIALPFHLMITYSGLVFFCFTYMPLIVAGTYGAGPQNRQVFFDEVFGRPGTTTKPAGVAAPLASIEAMTAEAERRWGAGQIRSIDVRDPGDANARVTFTRAHVTPSSNGERLDFDGVAGTVLPGSPITRTGPMLFNETMMSLHEGLFSGPVLRWLYFVAGIAGTAMIGTGLVYWTAKRRRRSDAQHAGLALVERLNVGTIAGLPVGVAVYFLANRLLPLDMPNRAAWEVNVMFIAWSMLLVHAWLRPLPRAWFEQFTVAAAACIAVPVVSALTTDRHLVASIRNGDWIFAGFELTVLAFGAAFGATAWLLRTGPRTATAGGTAAVDLVVEEPA